MIEVTNYPWLSLVHPCRISSVLMFLKEVEILKVTFMVSFCSTIGMRISALFTMKTLVALWVKCWPADLAVPGSIHSGVRNICNHKWGSIAHSLSLSPLHCLNITPSKRT